MCHGASYQRVDERVFFPHARLSDMDDWAVGRQVLSPPPFVLATRGESGEWVAAHQNRYLSWICSRAPERFSMMAMIAPGSRASALRQLTDVAELTGVLGVCVVPNLDDYLAAVEHLDFWQALADLRLAVFVHPADTNLYACSSFGSDFGTGMPTATGLFAARLLVSGILEKVPGLSLLLAHGGGTLGALIGRIDHEWALGDLPHLKAPPSHTLRRSVWVDSLVYTRPALLMCGAVFGESRVVYGSDYPFAAAQTPQQLREMGGDSVLASPGDPMTGRMP